MSQQDKEPEKKLIIDEDWKTQAQKEKEKLSAEPKEGEKEEKQPSRLPPASFVGMVSMLATQALFAMGVIRENEDKDKKDELQDYLDHQSIKQQERK